jgi:hypothetical protein
MPDDFTVQFNYTKKTLLGRDLPPYRYNVSAKVAYGHAALIVGYNNTDYTFTILNSWGSGRTRANPRTSGGITADGIFKVHMGLLGRYAFCIMSEMSLSNMHAAMTIARW